MTTLTRSINGSFRRRQLILGGAGAAIVTPLGARAQGVGMDARVPVVDVVAPTGRRSVIVPGSNAPLPAVRQPGYELFAGIERCITETIREPGYRTPLATRHPSASGGARAPWAERMTADEVLALARRLRCPAPVEFRDADVDEFLGIVLSRAHPYTAWDAGSFECRGRAILSRTRHVVGLAASRGIDVGGLELASEFDERVSRLPERVMVDALKRALDSSAGDRARRLTAALNLGNWDDALAEFSDRAPDAAGARLLQRALITERTATWLPRMERDLANGSALVVVGIAHLAGQQGLIALLQAKGYQLARRFVPSEPI
jgi:uncharacterized protein